MSTWLDDAVFYEVYPQSFQDSNADGIGDFQGIINRLDYIKDLGCNAIWINPCFDSSFYDAGYDVKDYFRTAPRYGSNEDLRNLFTEAHSRGIKVLLDLVPGHTAIDNEWFKQSMSGIRNEYWDRYIWADNKPEINSPYDSIRGFLCGVGDRDGRAALNCFATQPCLNYGFGTVTEDWQFAADSPQAQAGRELIQEIMAFWLGLGCDGFRVDMAASLVKEDPGHKWTMLLWQKVRVFLDENFPEAVLVSEWGDPVEALNAGFNMDFLLHFGPSHYMDLFRTNAYFAGESGASVKDFVNAYESMYEQTEGKGHICIPSSNHDMVRMRDTLSIDQMKLAFAFMLTMPGCPFIYYGDEIGMRYVHGLVSKEGGYERTGSRTPMQWDSTTNAGFSAGRPQDLYLPLDSSNDCPTVASQINDPESLLATVQELITLRHEYPALRSDGRVEFLYAEDKAFPFVYMRTSPVNTSASAESIIVAINPSHHDDSCPFEGNYGEKDIDDSRVLYSFGRTAHIENNQLIVPAGSVTIFTV